MVRMAGVGRRPVALARVIRRTGLAELSEEGLPALARDGEEGAVRLLAVADGSAGGGGVGDLDAGVLLSRVRRLPEGAYDLGHDVSSFKLRSTPRMSFALASGVNADDRSRSNALA